MKLSKSAKQRARLSRLVRNRAKTRTRKPLQLDGGTVGQLDARAVDWDSLGRNGLRGYEVSRAAYRQGNPDYLKSEAPKSKARVVFAGDAWEEPIQASRPEESHTRTETGQWVGHRVSLHGTQGKRNRSGLSKTAKRTRKNCAKVEIVR